MNSTPLAEAAQASTAGLRYLARVQLPSGEIPVTLTQWIDGRETVTPDPAVFPTALVAHVLRHLGEAHDVRSRARAFLAGEMKSGGVWSHWPAGHPTTLILPPDLDDTVCASLALALDDGPPIDNRALILRCRDRRGLFRTWILADLKWRGRTHWRVTRRQWLHRPTRFLFFRQTAAAPKDVDAVVNANVVAYLGRFRGRGFVVGWLLDILTGGDEERCDKWYDDAIVVRYFFTRALADCCPDARAIIVQRSLEALPHSALHRALLISTLAMWRTAPPAAWRTRLIEMQATDGSWPSAPLYSGGRARTPDGWCAPTPVDQARWGSAALTTAFCLEALTLAEQRL